MMDIVLFEEGFVKTEVKELPQKEITSDIRKLADETSKMDSSEFIDI